MHEAHYPAVVDVWLEHESRPAVTVAGTYLAASCSCGWQGPARYAAGGRPPAATLSLDAGTHAVATNVRRVSCSCGWQGPARHQLDPHQAALLADDEDHHDEKISAGPR